MIFNVGDFSYAFIIHILYYSVKNAQVSTLNSRVLFSYNSWKSIIQCNANVIMHYLLGKAFFFGVIVTNYIPIDGYNFLIHIDVKQKRLIHTG